MQVYLKKQNFFFRKAAIKFIIVIIAVAALNIFYVQAKNTFYGISSPFSNVFWKMGNIVSRSVDPLVNIKKLRNENASLQAENQKLVLEIFMLKQSILDQQEYRAALNNAKTQRLSIKAAKVISLNTVLDKATIDKGTVDGISENMAIVSSPNVLYGRVAKAYPRFSEVELISHKKSVVNIKVSGVENENIFVYGVVRGLGNLKSFLDLVDSNATISEGQVMVTSGLDGIFPAGLLVGNIVTIEKNDLKPFQTATVKAGASPFGIENVFVVTRQ